MNERSVFYSWQSDTPKKTTRYLIEDALRKACRGASERLHLDLRVDQDSRGEEGSPVIGDAVRSKIAEAVVFVGDLTIVAQRESAGGLVNSNVAVEWGWAGILLGTAGLIGVMNVAHGGPEQLPVDIRAQLVTARYRLSENDTNEARRAAAGELARRLEESLVESVRGRFFAALHEEAASLVRAIVNAPGDLAVAPDYDVQESATLSGLSAETAEAVMQDLQRIGLASDAGYLGSGTCIRVSHAFFVHFDPLYKNWNADRDAHQLAAILVQREWFNVQPLAEELGWSGRQMNPALFRILQAGFARASSAVPGGTPFYALQLYKNEFTLAFAERRASLPPVAQGALLRMSF
jgi:hypothetical protein